MRSNLPLAFPWRNSENDADGRSRPARAARVGGASVRSAFKTMNFWYYFWTINFIVAVVAFGLITVIVLVRGSQDLRGMFARLKESGARRELDTPPAAPKP